MAKWGQNILHFYKIRHIIQIGVALFVTFFCDYSLNHQMPFTHKLYTRIIQNYVELCQVFQKYYTYH